MTSIPTTQRRTGGWGGGWRPVIVGPHNTVIIVRFIVMLSFLGIANSL